MTVSELNKLHYKAFEKKDGVYSFKGCFWCVKNGKFLSYIDKRGTFLIRQGSFNMVAGEVKERYERRKQLLEWLKKQP